MENLASRLNEALEEKGWKKADLKRAAGLKSASTLTELCNGSRTESPQLPLIADALGVDVLWLQHGRGKKRQSDTPFDESAMLDAWREADKPARDAALRVLQSGAQSHYSPPQIGHPINKQRSGEERRNRYTPPDPITSEGNVPEKPFTKPKRRML